MTAVLGALVLVVGVTAALNLVFTLAVVRRLREHEEKLSRATFAEAEVPEALAAGERPDAFEATTVDGARVTEDSLAGGIVGAFSPGCGPCEEAMPKFIEAVRHRPKDGVLAVVADTDGAAAIVEQLRPVARVVLEPPAGALQAALRIPGFPTLYTFDADGAVATGSIDAVLNAPVPA
jgi:thiol-disulfide isomerase/thioredoxin